MGCISAGRTVVNVSSKDSSGRQATRCPRSEGRLELVSLVMYGIRNSAAEQTSAASGRVVWRIWMIRCIFCVPTRVILEVLASWVPGSRGTTLPMGRSFGE